MTLSITDAATVHPDRVALIADSHSLTFAQLADRVHADASSPSTALSIYRALERREPLILVHPRLTDAERAQLPALGDLPAECAFAMFTSGSSGAPKAVMLSRDNLLASAAASGERLGWRDDDRWLCPIPLAHVGGLSVVTRCLIARRCAVLGELADLREHTATIASVVPAQLARLLDTDAPAHLRAVLVGGAPLSGSLRGAALARGYPVRTTYGMTEACSQIATQADPTEPGVGRPLSSVEVDTSDGRLRVRGASVMMGYANAPSPFDLDGWFNTGDLGHVDEAGFLHITGRADDLIITGGENVNPSEVEAALLAIPGVEDACVFGVPDDTWGHIVAAAIVAAETPCDDRVSAGLESALASFKRPRRLCYVSEFARTASGKVDRAAIATVATPRLRTLR